MTEYLNVVFKLALFALAKSVDGDADMWKVYWITSFATFAISCYCLKLFVERKRAQLITPTSQSIAPMKSEQACFLTATNALYFLFPLSYLRLAFAYFMDLNLKNDPSEVFWKGFSYATKIYIDALGVLISVMSILQICNSVQKVEDQSVADAKLPKVAPQIDVENG